MATKVSTCGNYECVHCSSDGRCLVSKISITPDGKCGLYKPVKGKAITVHSEQDEHTNMC